jgi:hypothetical protein
MRTCLEFWFNKCNHVFLCLLQEHEYVTQKRVSSTTADSSTLLNSKRPRVSNVVQLSASSSTAQSDLPAVKRKSSVNSALNVGR